MGGAAGAETNAGREAPPPRASSPPPPAPAPPPIPPSIRPGMGPAVGSLVRNPNPSIAGAAASCCPCASLRLAPSLPPTVTTMMNMTAAAAPRARRIRLGGSDERGGSFIVANTLGAPCSCCCGSFLAFIAFWSRRSSRLPRLAVSLRLFLSL